MSRHRSFWFVLNNYTEDEVEQWKNVEARFIQFGKEIAPTTNTPHLQGYIYFSNAKTLAACIKFVKIPRTKFGICNGDVASNIKYTGKDKDVFTKGDPPIDQEEKGARGAEFWTQQRLAAREGRIDDIHPEIRFNKFELIKKHRREYLSQQPLEHVTTEHLWFFGKPRTGKSRKARELTGEKHYDKDFSKWWDEYEQQEIVLIEDIDTSHAWMLLNLKRWADRYPFPAEQKGLGKIQIRPKQIIVTSNFSIIEIWPNPKDHEPLMERFTQTEFFKL